MALLASYNLHNLVRFDIEHPRSTVNSLLGDPFGKYRLYQTKKDILEDPEPDFTVRIRRLDEPDVGWVYESSEKYKLSHDYFYSKSYSYKLINWQIEIDNLSGNNLRCQILLTFLFTFP